MAALSGVFVDAPSSATFSGFSRCIEGGVAATVGVVRSTIGGYLPPPASAAMFSTKVTMDRRRSPLEILENA